MSRLSQRIENFNKVFEIFQKSVNSYKSDRKNAVFHMALIQSFEICFEIGWKVLKDFLYQKGIVAKSPKDVIKEAFSIEILPNAQIWIDMQKDRNTSSHEYTPDKTDTILENISSVYYDEFLEFHKWLEIVSG